MSNWPTDFLARCPFPFDAMSGFLMRYRKLPATSSFSDYYMFILCFLLLLLLFFRLPQANATDL